MTTEYFCHKIYTVPYICTKFGTVIYNKCGNNWANLERKTPSGFSDVHILVVSNILDVQSVFTAPVSGKRKNKQS